MICYCCQREITSGYYWAPLPRAGAYAAICKECHKQSQEDAKKEAAEKTNKKSASTEATE